MSIKLKLILGGLILAVLIFLGAVYLQIRTNQEQNGTQTGIPAVVQKVKESLGIYPACPSNLEGILTAPLMEPKYISALTPLGNLNPPGHTSPVDHIYFATTYDGKIPLYAPADAWITQITEISKQDSSGKYIAQGYTLDYVVCQGLGLTFANYTDLAPDIKNELTQNKGGDCKRGIVKPGHTGGPEGQCYYRLNYKVKAGEEIGWVQRVKREEGGYDLPFEIWAADYNKPSRSDVNWSYYNDDRYAHSMCLFDLYAGTLKDEFYQKFGIDDNGKGGGFQPRTIPPLCGQVNQDIVGTIQGMWFGEPPQSQNQSIEFDGKGLSFIHNNIDPTIAEIGIGGNFMSPGVISFTPNHTGTIDREPSEVKADGNIYCYNSSGTGWEKDFGKVLVKLISSHKLQVEYQKSSCGFEEAFVNPLFYER